VGCLVGMIAFMAVLGLIPLWVTDFLRYFGKSTEPCWVER